MANIFPISHWIKFSFLIVFLLLLSSCGGGSGSPDDSSVTESVTLKGTADIPGSTTRGPLLILAQDADGTTVGRGATNSDGTFEIKLKLSGEQNRALVIAIDSANPQRMALAIVDASNNDGANATLDGSDTRNSLKDVISIEINARSTASAVIRYSNDGMTEPDRELSTAELTEINTLANELEFNATDVCSIDQSPATIGPSQVIDTPVAQSGSGGEAFSRIANGNGPLLDRVKQAQEHISSRVKSLNRFGLGNNYILNTPAGFGGIIALRIAIASRTNMGLHGYASADADAIENSELSKAAEMIYAVGYGNCREKSVSAAYAATFFSEFKQISVVAVDATKYRGTHAFTIACVVDKSIFNLDEIIGNLQIGGRLDQLPANDIGCIVIDPWAEITMPLTSALGSSETWISFTDNLPIVEDGTDSLMRSHNRMEIDLTVEGFAPDACSAESSDFTGSCDAFTIPDSLLTDIVHCCEGPAQLLVDTSADWTFDTEGMLPPYEYAIDFGDGAIETSSTSADTVGFSHSYNLIGQYSIQITVTDSVNSIISSEPFSVEVEEIDNSFAVYHITNYSGDGYLTVDLTRNIESPPLLRNFPGGGINLELKVVWEFLDGTPPVRYESAAQARESTCPLLNCFYRPSLAGFIQKAVSSIGNIGLDGSFVSACPLVENPCQ